MLFDLCTKDEGNPFTTKIWVVGSYTDTLLKRAPNFLKIQFREKEQNSFRDALPVKQQGVKVITCGLPANG